MNSKPFYSLGCGDRFGREGEAQLAAYVEVAGQGIPVHPVWNKSHREHTTVHTEPASVRAEADAACQAGGWEHPYYVDALRHDSSCPDYNPGFRQLLHLAYKVAYELGDDYFAALDEHHGTIARSVTDNLLHRHLLPLFCAGRAY